MAQSTAKAGYWSWIYAAAAVLAGLFGVLRAAGALATIEPMLTMLMWVIAFLYGILYFEGKEVMNFGLRGLISKFASGYAAQLTLAGLGTYLAGWFEGWAAFLAFVAMGMLLRFFYDRFFAR